MRIKLILLAIFVASSTMLAQDSHRESRRAERKQQMEETKTWLIENVLPSLQQWHKEYDASLMPEQLSTLQNLRAQAKALREDHKEQRNQAFANTTGDKSDRREQMRELHQKQRAEMKVLLEQLKPIAEASKPKLKELFERNKEQIADWKQQIKEMVGKNRKHNSPDRDGSMPGMGIDGGKRAAIKFMLWDGSEPEFLNRSEHRAHRSAHHHDRGQRGDATNRRSRHAEITSPVVVSPNPSQDQASVHVENIHAQSAVIEVFTMDGTLVQRQQTSVVNNSVDDAINTSALAPGTYMVSVSTPNGRSSTTLVINK